MSSGINETQLQNIVRIVVIHLVTNRKISQDSAKWWTSGLGWSAIRYGYNLLKPDVPASGGLTNAFLYQKIAFIAKDYVPTIADCPIPNGSYIIPKGVDPIIWEFLYSSGYSGVRKVCQVYTHNKTFLVPILTSDSRCYRNGDRRTRFADCLVSEQTLKIRDLFIELLCDKDITNIDNWEEYKPVNQCIPVSYRRRGDPSGPVPPMLCNLYPGFPTPPGLDQYAGLMRACVRDIEAS